MRDTLSRLAAKIPAVRRAREERQCTENLESTLRPVIVAAEQSVVKLRHTTERQTYWGEKNHISEKVRRSFSGYASDS